MVRETRQKNLGGPGVLKHLGAVAVSHTIRRICEDRITRVLVSSEDPVVLRKHRHCSFSLLREESNYAPQGAQSRQAVNYKILVWSVLK